MSRSILPIKKTNRDTRRQEIQAHWSADERLSRAKAGRQRREILADLLFDPTDQDIWAVGAPCSDDLSRLAG